MLWGQRKHKDCSSKLPALLHPFCCYPHVEPFFPTSLAAPCNSQAAETLKVSSNISRIWIGPNRGAGSAKYHTDLNFCWSKVLAAEVPGVTLPWQRECSTLFASLGKWNGLGMVQHRTSYLEDCCSPFWPSWDCVTASSEMAFDNCSGMGFP